MNQPNTPSGGPPDLDQVFRSLWLLIKRKGRRSTRDKSEHPPQREAGEAPGTSTAQRQEAKKRPEPVSVFVDNDKNSASVESADSHITQWNPIVATRGYTPPERQSPEAHKSVLIRKSDKVNIYKEESRMDLRSVLHRKQALRQAIVLMEILDRPLALRRRKRNTR